MRSLKLFTIGLPSLFLAAGGLTLMGGGAGGLDAGSGLEQKAPLAASVGAPPPPPVYGEWRIRVRPEKGAEYNQLIQAAGLPLFREAGGRMVGWWTTLVGNLYEHVTLWEFDGMGGFEKGVGFLGKEDRFKDFVARRDPLLAGEVSRFLRLLPFAERPALPLAGNVVIHEIHRVPLGRMERYLAFAREAGPLLKKHKFRPVGPWRVDVGRWSEVTFLFLFESLAERERLIDEFSAQAEAASYAARLGDLADEVITQVLLPAPFSR